MSNPRGEATVVCLRPRRDFEQMGVAVPEDLSIEFFDNERQIDEIGPDVRAVILPSAGQALSPALFARATSLELIQYTGAGVDRVSRDIVASLGCAVCNVPGASAPDVASYVVVATGALLRKIPTGDRLMKLGRYDEARARLAPAHVRGFRGLRVGVIGFGGIGFQVASAFHALGAKVMWFDPAPAAQDASGLFEQVDLNTLLERCEVLTVHVPLLDSTKGLIGEAELATMRAGSLVVNAARGGIVDEDALMAALDSGHLGGVVLDVYSQEPLPESSPLVAWAQRHLDDVIVTPHIGGVTPEASRVLFDVALSNVHRVLLEGGEPLHRVW